MKKFIDFCKTVGKLLQTKGMEDNKSFMICNVKPEALEAVQAYIDEHNLQISASFNANDGNRPFCDKDGNPYPASISIYYNAINVEGWE